MTHPYFASYHVLITPVIRGAWRATSAAPRLIQLALLAVLISAAAYGTAFLEAYSIQSFPHYRYPDAVAMFKYGSAFYATMFIVTYPM